MASLNMRLIYDGVGPVHWDPFPGAFGLQNKAGVLQAGESGENGRVIFDFLLLVKVGAASTPVFGGEYAHGPSANRFLYLSWAQRDGGYAQRLKIPLVSIRNGDVQQALARSMVLVATVLDHHPKATATGVNIGGTREVVWQLG